MPEPQIADKKLAAAVAAARADLIAEQEKRDAQAARAIAARQLENERIDKQPWSMQKNPFVGDVDIQMAPATSGKMNGNFIPPKDINNLTDYKTEPKFELKTQPLDTLPDARTPISDKAVQDIITTANQNADILKATGQLPQPQAPVAPQAQSTAPQAVSFEDYGKDQMATARAAFGNKTAAPVAQAPVTPQDQSYFPPQIVNNLVPLFEDLRFSSQPVEAQLKILGQDGSIFAHMSPAKYFQLREETGYPLNPALRPQPTSLKDHIISLIRPFVTPALMTAGASVGGPAGAAAGIVTGALADKHLQDAMDKEPTSLIANIMDSPEGSMERRGQNYLEQELGGIAIGKGLEWSITKFPGLFNKAMDAGGRAKDLLTSVPKAIKGELKTGNPFLDEIGASYSMYKNSELGEGTIPGWVESLFHAKKIARIRDAAVELANRKTKQRVESLTNITDPTQYMLNKLVQKETQDALTRANKAVNDDFAPSLRYAEANVKPAYSRAPESITTPKNPNIHYRLDAQGKIMVDSSGQPIIDPREIAGSIELSDSMQHLQQTMLSLQETYKDIGPGASNYIPVKDLFSKLKAVIDPLIDKDGTVIASQPIAYREALALARKLEEFGYGPEQRAVAPTAEVQQIRDFLGYLLSDIRQGLKNMPNGGREALKSFDKGMVSLERRNAIFDPPYADTAKDNILRRLAQTNSTTNSEVMAIVNDPAQLAKALKTNKLNVNGLQVADDKMRRTLQGVKLQSIFDDALLTDAAGNKRTRFDSTDLMSSVRQAKSNGTWDMLFESKTEQADIEKYISEVAASQYTKYKDSITPKLATARGLTFVALTGMKAAGGGNTSFLGTGALGIQLMGDVMAALFTNHKLATLMIQNQKAAPLGISKQAFSQMVAKALNGIKTNAMLPDGKKVYVEFQPDGSVKEIK